MNKRGVTLIEILVLFLLLFLGVTGATHRWRMVRRARLPLGGNQPHRVFLSRCANLQPDRAPRCGRYPSHSSMSTWSVQNA